METTDHRPIPTYGHQPDQPGLYLGLFHGRRDPGDRMDDWGFDGPLIGPLVFVHTTYASTIQLGFETETRAKRYFPTQSHHELDLHDDMVVFDGKFYGDWTVFYVPEGDCAPPPDTFRNVVRVPRLLHAHKRTNK